MDRLRLAEILGDVATYLNIVPLVQRVIVEYPIERFKMTCHELDQVRTKATTPGLNLVTEHKQHAITPSVTPSVERK